MKFGRAQKTELTKNWNGYSWFYRNSSLPVREIISKAYGLKLCTPNIRQKCQEDVSFALELFSRKIGCEKAQATHALLSGSIQHLVKALQGRQDHIRGTQDDFGSFTGFDTYAIQTAWENAFRDANIGIAR